MKAKWCTDRGSDCDFDNYNYSYNSSWLTRIVFAT